MSQSMNSGIPSHMMMGIPVNNPMNPLNSSNYKKSYLGG